MDSNAAEFLSPELLGRLEAGLKDRDPALVTRLAPGLTDAEIDEATKPLGISLPDEARVWWRWHNGVDSSNVVHRLFGAGLQFISLARAASTYRVYADIWNSHPDVRPSNWWAPKWFPFVERGSGTLVCDCSVVSGRPSPIRAVEHGLGGDVAHASSLGQVVQWWTDALEAGAWYFNQELGGWDADDERIPSERRGTRLV